MRNGSFAFLVHPRASVREDLGRIWSPLAAIPESVFQGALRTLPLPPVTLGQVRTADRTLGQILMVPLSGRQMLALPRPFVLKKVERAVDRAAADGARLVGLGALTAPVTTGGQRLADRTDVGVTNGNAFTAAITFEGLTKLLALCPAPDPIIAVVGASGSVGTCLCRLIARRLPDLRLLMVARDPDRLTAAADLVRADGGNPREATTMAAIKRADIVILLTSSADCLLRSEHLKEGAIILDDTQPRNTSPALLEERPDLLLVDGGLVEVKGIQISCNIGFPRGQLPACLAETMLLTLEGHEGHFSIGAPKVEQAETISALATKWGRYGFTLAPFHSFGRPLAPVVDQAVPQEVYP